MGKTLNCIIKRMVCKNCDARILVARGGIDNFGDEICDDCGGELVEREFKEYPTYSGMGEYKTDVKREEQ